MNNDLQSIPRELNKLRRDTSLLLQASGIDVSTDVTFQLEKQNFVERIIFLANKKGIEINKEFVANLLNDENGVETLWEIIGEKPLLPLDLLVSYAETLLIEDEIDDAKLETLFTSGLVQKQFKEKLRIENQVYSRDLNFIIGNQTGDSNRSIIELVSNAIDFSNTDGIVEVYTHENGYTIRDYGKGMSKRDLIFRLPVPNISGERASGKSSIGKFGLGFYTTLMHLQNNFDSVEIRTSLDGISGQYMKFIYLLDKIYVQYHLQDEVLQGTEISINVRNFTKSLSEQNLKKYLSLKRGARILLNDESISKAEKRLIIESENSAILVNTKKEKISHIHLLINGVLIESLHTEGLNLYREISIDLPSTTTLPESRDFIPYDQEIRKSLISLIDSIVDSEVSFKQKITIFNSLIEVISQLERRGKKNNSEESLIVKISDYIKQFSDNYTFLPNKESFSDIKANNKIYISELIKSFRIYDLVNSSLVSTFSGNEHSLYLVDFIENPTSPIQIYENYILIDRKAWEIQNGDSTLFDIYLNEIRKSKTGKFAERTNNQVVDNSGKEKFYNKNYRDIIPGKIREIIKREDINYIYLRNLIWGIDKEVKMIEFSISENFINEIFQFVSGEISFEDLSKKGIYEDPIIHKAISSPEWKNYLEVIRFVATIFFSKDFESNIFNKNEEDSVDYIKNLISNIKSKYPEEIADELNLEIHSKLSIEEIVKTLDENYKYRTTSTLLLREVLRLVRNIRNFIIILEDKDLDTELFLKYMDLVEQSPNPSFYLYYASMWVDIFKELGNEFMSWFYDEIKTFYESPLISHSSLVEILIMVKNIRTYFLSEFDSTYKWKIENGYETNNVLFSDLTTLDDKEEKLSYMFQQILTHLNHQKGFRGNGHIDIVKSSRSAKDINGWLGFQSKLIETLDTKKESIFKSLPYLFSNIRKVLNLENVKNLLETNKSLMEDMYTTSYGVYYYPSEYMIISAENLFEDTLAYSHQLSDRKLEIISQTIYTKFQSSEPTKFEMGRFFIYLQKVLRYGNLSDEEFEKIQDLLVKDFSTKVERSSGSWSETVNSPISIYELETVRKMARSDIPADKLPHFGEFWKGIYSPADRSIISIRLKERLNRAIKIWEEISSLTTYEYDYIRRRFKSSSQDHRSGNYSNFNSDSNILDVPQDIRPYIIFYRSGEPDSLNSEISSLGRDIQLDYYDNQIRLSHLVIARKLKSKLFFEETNSPDNFANWIEDVAKDKNTLLAQRSLIHGIYHQSVIDPFIFLRELIQNSADAIDELNPNNEDQESNQININEAIEAGKYAVQIKDFVGINFETVMGYLLAPEFSTKKGEQRGKFGIGFLNIFRGADKVVIQTTKDNVTTYLKIEPITENGEIVDLNIQYSVREDSSQPSTIIRKYSQKEHKNLQSAFLQSAVMKYGGYLNSDVVEIKFNDRIINNPTLDISTRENGFGKFTVRRSGDLVMTQGGVYVNQLPEELLRSLPQMISSEIREVGLNLELDRKVPLTRSRTSIAKKDMYLPEIKKIFIPLAFDYFLHEFAEGNSDYDYLPYDFFDSPSKYGFIPENKIFLFEDIQKINSVGYLENYSNYEDSENLLKLIVHIKSIEINDQKYSLYEIAEKLNDRSFKFNNLPYEIQRILNERREREFAISRKEGEFKEKGIEPIADFTLNPSLTEFLKTDADVYLSVIELTEKLASMITNRDLEYTYYLQNDNSIAHAGSRNIGWNLGSDKFKEVVKNLSTILRRKTADFVGIEKFKKLFFNTITHEIAHIVESTTHYESTHNSKFYNIQKSILIKLMYEINLDSLFQEVMDKYNGSYIDPLDFAAQYTKEQ